jgi:hypothetical protein
MKLIAALLLFVLAGCSAAPQQAPAQPGVQIPVNADAPAIEGRPQTAVVVTQCDQLVVAYLTMASGQLVRFDKDSGLPFATVLEMAYAATRSERVEVSCEGGGAEGFESHTPSTNI